MKKTLLMTAIAAQLATQLNAGGHIDPLKVDEAEALEMTSGEADFYFVAKTMMVLGDNVNEEETTLKGNRGYGYGFDIGYRLGKGFAVEYDFSYVTNTVAKSTEEETQTTSAKYYTSSLDVVYTVEASENVGLFAKVGYEYEWEKIKTYNNDEMSHDFVFGAGTEIAINENYKLIAEYEHSFVEGPHGDSVFAGLMFNF